MTFWVLVGEGPNSVEVPALIFTSEEEALNRCREIPKPEGYSVRDRAKYRWHDDPMDEFSDKVVDSLYTSYYGGCGECYAAVLVEVEAGKPFVGFNLD